MRFFLTVRHEIKAGVNKTKYVLELGERIILQHWNETYFMGNEAVLLLCLSILCLQLVSPLQIVMGCLEIKRPLFRSTAAQLHSDDILWEILAVSARQVTWAAFLVLEGLRSSLTSLDCWFSWYLRVFAIIKHGWNLISVKPVRTILCGKLPWKIRNKSRIK